MGSAVVAAMLDQKIYSVNDLTIVEKYQNSFTEKLKAQGVKILSSISDLSGDVGIVVLAVKPQDSAQMLKDLAPKTSEKTLVISIMAGITLKVLETGLKQAQVIRCMPNIPCVVNFGMSVYCGNSRVSAESFEVAQLILAAMGRAFQVDDEIMIDAATAISGSGPAYVFYLAEALKEGARKLGFDETQADMLATQTLLGSAVLLDKSDDGPAELRRKVTSPGGTTAAALKVYEDGELKETLIKGFDAAFKRSIELGK
ncbi:pyrroline-5-carboxylate reductase [bacterium]|nr:pyrroline-5-carboxylate reductase [bacterium]